MDRELIWPAPAKLNLFLHITGRRADGYHLLQTVFRLLDYSDFLKFDITATDDVSRAYELPGVTYEKDIIVRAAHVLRPYRKQSTAGVTIHLDKRLPIGGGLGGGSSTAATTLVALNYLWGCGLDMSQLARLGLSLGADVPVFVHGRTAWGEGVGENLQEIALPPVWYVVLAPRVSVSTAEIFSDPQLRRDCPAITIRDFLAGRTTSNVCEPCVKARYPEVAAALEALSVYSPARLTGTGACVFAEFVTEQAARQVWDKLSSHWNGFVASGVNISPLHTALNRATAGVE